MMKWCVSIVCLFVVCSGAWASSPTHIIKLKELHLRTSLAEQGYLETVVVVPETEYLFSHGQELIRRLSVKTGISFKIISDQTSPEEVLKNHHVITLGNMANNRFIRRLYEQWQVILDPTYPGKGGYVVRSLHNPYGTGRNVIFLGGSDESGVTKAAEIFLTKLHHGANGDLAVGQLMEIKLGADVRLPKISPHTSDWPVFSWTDSWRKTASGRKVGYPPASTFGWNPISIAGMLYYLSGQQEYLDCFKKMALPDHDNLPTPNRIDPAFKDPLNPLVKNDHYRSHLLDIVYDLIEETPLLSDRERLQITNKLLARQLEYDPDSERRTLNGSRHELWHLLNIYTGSRYFSTYYPDEIWNRRIENVRISYRSLIGNPTWGTRDTLYWVPTSLEPVFEFFLMDGFQEFVESGTAATMLRGLEVLLTGDEVDKHNQYLSMGLLLRAYHMTGSTRYLWMLKQSGFDLSLFRIGQSYWPERGLAVKAPDDLNGRLLAAPLADADRQAAGNSVAADDGFQVLSYRTGIEKTSDYLLLDGFEGLGRHPFQLNTLLRLRMFGGKNILSGYASDLKVWFNGMYGRRVPRAAALRNQMTTDRLAYLDSEVPNMPGSSWRRQFLLVSGVGAVSIDRLTARDSGDFDIISSWQTASEIEGAMVPSRRVLTKNGTGFVSADQLYEKTGKTVASAHLRKKLRSGQSVVFANLFIDGRKPKVLSPLRGGGYWVSGTSTAYVGLGNRNDSILEFDGDFCWLSSRRLLLIGVKRLVLGGTVILQSSRPISIAWELGSGKCKIVSSTAEVVTLLGRPLAISAGEQQFEYHWPQNGSTAFFSGLAELSSDVAFPVPADTKKIAQNRGWKPAWEWQVNGEVTELELAGDWASGLWVASRGDRGACLTRLSINGEEQSQQLFDSDILSLVTAQTSHQEQYFDVLAGFRDDTLRAFSAKGDELWSVKASLHSSFRVGERFLAPTFTDPRPPINMTGVYSLMAADIWGKGTEEIVVGRPSTLEFRTLNGDLRGRVPTRWGKNTELALLNKTASLSKTPLLLAGKGYTGNPQLSAINGDYQNISDYLFASIPTGYTSMHAWLQRGVSDLAVADLEGDGSEEVIYTLSGNWNELRVYMSTSAIYWMKYFGPGSAGDEFMTSLQVADINGNGKKEVLVGTKMGWFFAFDGKGEQLLRKRFAGGVTRIAVREGQSQIVVGCEDGTITLLDGGGRLIANAAMKGAVTVLEYSPRGVLVADTRGTVKFFPHLD